MLFRVALLFAVCFVLATAGGEGPNSRRRRSVEGEGESEGEIDFESGDGGINGRRRRSVEGEEESDFESGDGGVNGPSRRDAGDDEDEDGDANSHRKRDGDEEDDDSDINNSRRKRSAEKRQCLNRGVWNADEDFCSCTSGFHGANCEGPEWDLVSVAEQEEGSDCTNMPLPGPAGYSLQRCLTAAKTKNANTVNYGSSGTCLLRICSPATDLKMSDEHGGYDVYVYKGSVSATTSDDESPAVSAPIGSMPASFPAGNWSSDASGDDGVAVVSGAASGYGSVSISGSASSGSGDGGSSPKTCSASYTYSTTSKTCEPCASNCVVCTMPATCMAAGCNAGYYYKASTLDCSRCAFNCMSCTSATTCNPSGCISGYTYSSTSRICHYKTTTRATTTTTESPVTMSAGCGSGLFSAAGFGVSAPTGWTLCYLPNKRVGGRYCRSLVSNVQDSYGRNYSSASALTAAGGSFGCYTFSEGKYISTGITCNSGSHHTMTTTSSIGVFAVCIKFPAAPTTTPTPTTAATTTGLKCGSKLRSSSISVSSGSKFCYGTSSDILYYTQCKTLIKDVADEYGRMYADFDALTAAGGSISCQKYTSTSYMSGNICRTYNLRETSYISSSYKVMGVCIKYPASPVTIPAPTTAAPPTAAPTIAIPAASCGTKLRKWGWITVSPGYKSCYNSNSYSGVYNIQCRYLVKDVIDDHGRKYADYNALTAAGGSISCKRHSSTYDMSTTSICKTSDYYTTTYTTSYYRYLQVCIKYPAAPSTSPAPTTAAPEPEPEIAATSTGLTCGTKLRIFSGITVSSEYKFCYTTSSDSGVHSTSCTELIRNVTDEHGRKYANYNALKAAGGILSCQIYTSTSSLSSSICRTTSHGIYTYLSSSPYSSYKVLAACIRFPAAPTPAPAPTTAAAGLTCGTKMHSATSVSTPTGWNYCSVSYSDPGVYNQYCRVLIKDVTDDSGRTYADYTALTAAGGTFGCYRYSSYSYMSSYYPCRTYYRTTTYLYSGSSYKYMGVCIKFPA